MFARVYFDLVYNRLYDSTTARLVRYKQVQEQLASLLKAGRGDTRWPLPQSGGRFNYGPGFLFLLVLPPAPNMSGSMIDSMAQYVSFKAIPPREGVSTVPFQQRVAAGFQMTLPDGVDVIGAIASVLVKMGEQFEEQARKTRLSPAMLHPAYSHVSSRPGQGQGENTSRYCRKTCGPQRRS
ncbi:MAG: hypothetical protein ACOC7M_03720 [Chloroflexota bacterium]